MSKVVKEEEEKRKIRGTGRVPSFQHLVSPVLLAERSLSNMVPGKPIVIFIDNTNSELNVAYAFQLHLKASYI